MRNYLEQITKEMNREAAALGVPVYSIFRGKIGAVDQYLAKLGRLKFIETVKEIEKKIKVIKRTPSTNLYFGNRETLNTIINQNHKKLNIPEISA